LQGIFLHQPMTNSEKEEKYGDDGQQRRCAQNCQEALKMLCDDSYCCRGPYLSERSSAKSLKSVSAGGEALPA
jgi:hypothetical protein